jgi:hypothetical protein
MARYDTEKVSYIERIVMNRIRSENYSLRSPQALHKVRAPSGPRRHSGVSVVLHEWHLGLPVARFCTHFLVFLGHTHQCL